MPKGVYAHQRKPIKERFMSKVDKDGPNGCWVWTGSIATNGYGAFRIETSSPVGAHRVSMMLFRGVPITPGRAMNVDHLCPESSLRESRPFGIRDVARKRSPSRKSGKGSPRRERDEPGRSSPERGGSDMRIEPTVTDGTTKAIYLTAFIVALLALGWACDLFTYAVSCIGPILPLRIRLVKTIDLQQEEADERRRRLELDAAAGRVRP